jgi:hypothetical protein
MNDQRQKIWARRTMSAVLDIENAIDMALKLDI